MQEEITDQELGEATTPEVPVQSLAHTETPSQQMSWATTAPSSIMNPNVYIQMKKMSHDFIASKAIPKHYLNAEQVFVALQTGIEMGMQPMEAINSLYPVNGQFNVWGKAVVKRLRDHGWAISYEKETDTTCTASVYRLNNTKQRYTETYDFAEAEASGYTKDSYGKLKIGWREGINRKLKLRYGVINLIIKTYIPEVLGSAVGIVEVEQDFDPQEHYVEVGGKQLPKPDRSEKKETGSIAQAALDKKKEQVDGA